MLVRPGLLFGRRSSRRARPIATRGFSYNFLSGGTNTGGNYKLQHIAASDAGFSSPVLLYGNWSITGTELDGSDSITVRAAIEYPSGTFTPVYFSGARDVVIAPGGFVRSDPVAGLTIPAGAALWTRTYVTVASVGQKWPYNSVSNQRNAYVEGAAEGTATSDLTTTGTIPDNIANCYSPLAILGTPARAIPAVLLAGDSIMYNGTGGDTTWADFGLADHFGTVKIAKIGDRAQFFLSSHAKRLRADYGATHVICNYGINDIDGGSRTLAQLQSDITGVWQAFVDLGIKVFQTTLTPYTSTTDSFATTANQTPKMGATKEAIRTSYNDWIRTTPAPLTGYFETADLVESARNSGLWAADGTPNRYTSDGLHPNANGNTALAAAIDRSRFGF